MSKKAGISKTGKAGLIAGGVIIAGIVAYFILRKKKAETAPVVDSEGNIVQSEEVVTSGVSWPIRRKSGANTTVEEREIIKVIQTYLNRNSLLFYRPLDVDGIYGPLTEETAKRVLGVTTISYKLYTETILPYVQSRAI